MRDLRWVTASAPYRRGETPLFIFPSQSELLKTRSVRANPPSATDTFLHTVLFQAKGAESLRIE